MVGLSFSGSIAEVSLLLGEEAAEDVSAFGCVSTFGADSDGFCASLLKPLELSARLLDGEELNRLRDVNWEACVLPMNNAGNCWVMMLISFAINDLAWRVMRNMVSISPFAYFDSLKLCKNLVIVMKARNDRVAFQSPIVVCTDHYSNIHSIDRSSQIATTNSPCKFFQWRQFCQTTLDEQHATLSFKLNIYW